ncbi:MAG TPA: YezD family protein [Clostridia bacterium]|nr:YezD family protein [Clostridia bacterium]
MYDVMFRAMNRELVPEWLTILRKRIESLEYGIVEVVVHNGRVVEIDTTEKLRFGARLPAGLVSAPEGERV